MPIDPQARRILDAVALGGARGALPGTVAERRGEFQKLMQIGRMATSVAKVQERDVQGAAGNLRARVYSPASSPDAPLPCAIYFHGGGFVAGSLDTHDGLCRALAESAACRIVSVEYRLAPEHEFPAALDDAFAATVGVIERAADFRIDPGRVAVAGDSAGATLAALVTQLAVARGRPAIAAQLLLCPILDLAPTYPSRMTFASGYLVDRSAIERDFALYLNGKADASGPLVSPLRAPSLARLPPALIHSAEFDPFRDEAAAYAERLARARVAVSHTCHPGMIHNFLALGGVLSYGRRAIEAIGRELHRALFDEHPQLGT